MGRPALVLAVASLVTAWSFAAERLPVTVPTAEQLHGVVTRLKTRLEISAPVVVSIVPGNVLMMSIEAPGELGGIFRLEIDTAFLASLTEEELEAAIAHELGHVWLFTHHPYLQTEALVNQIAMRAVSRGALERVYEKVWKNGVARGDLTNLLGPEPRAAGLASESPDR